MHETSPNCLKSGTQSVFPRAYQVRPECVQSRSIAVIRRGFGVIPGRPMKKIFFSAVMLFLFTSCVTVRERGDTSLPTWRTFHARFDRVWGVLVSEISSFAVIKTIDKTNGLITTEPLKMGSGLMSEILLKLYAHRPSKFLGTWDDGRTVLSFLATSKGSSTTVRITARFTGFESNVTHSWMEWPTRGVLENFLLDHIANDLGAPSVS
jgi:hypothetical protein